MWPSLSPIAAGFSGVGQCLKAAAQHWLSRKESGAVADIARRDIGSTRAIGEREATATLLPFPIRGEALLVRLATHLKSVVETIGRVSPGFCLQ